MNKNIEKELINVILIGNDPFIIEEGNFCFIAKFLSKYSISGYVCSLEKDYTSNFKQPQIRQNKKGEKYIVADRKRFSVDNIKQAEVDIDSIKKCLESHITSKTFFIKLKEKGYELGYNIENQDFFIDNLNAYLKNHEKGSNLK